jgi:hypothetical protein
MGLEERLRHCWSVKSEYFSVSYLPASFSGVLIPLPSVLHSYAVRRVTIYLDL